MVLQELSSKHWHGVTSIPMSVSIPFLGNSGYRKALDAKAKLVSLIRSRLKGPNCPAWARQLRGKLSEDLIASHALLFSCALIPKGVGSVLAMLYEVRSLLKKVFSLLLPTSRCGTSGRPRR